MWLVTSSHRHQGKAAMFPCSLCDVKLNSLEQRKAHCRGKNHIKRVEAREKALELGTDFDRTPDHCEVCNVPLTSKMTAIDHFKGKMHQKKVKTVEDLRRGFRNFCDVCDVRLQSLKVSEAHFNGKQHKKRERKLSISRVKEKSVLVEGKPDQGKAENIADLSQTSFAILPSKSCNSGTTWESLNCDSDNDTKDPLSEFRSSLSGKSNSPEAGTPHSTSPNDVTESYFSFEDTVLLQTATFSNTEQIYSHFNSDEPSVPAKFEPSVPATTTPDAFTVKSKALIPSDDVFHTSNGLWESKAKHLVPNYLNETCKGAFRESSFFNDYLIQNGGTARSPDAKQLTSLVLQLLTKLDYPISCDDIAQRVGCASPSAVHSVLRCLEKQKKLSKSGYNPALWSTFSLPLHQGNIQQHYPTNNSCPREPYARDSCMQTPFFQRTNDSVTTSIAGGTALSTTQAVLSSSTAILSSSTTTARMEAVIQPLDLPQVFEANLINLFQQNGAISTVEIQTKLGFPDEVKLGFVLENLQQRRVITKESDVPQRWRLASATRLNDVGVIGEERRRKSPVQMASTGAKVDKIMPSPPRQNGFSENVHDGFRHLSESPERNAVSSNKHYRYSCDRNTNGVWQDLNYLNGLTNVHHKACPAANARFSQANLIMPANPGDQHGLALSTDHSPSSLIQTETDEFLDDLTETVPNGYQQELYQQAMQEDLVCYLPAGTGKGVVMASVVHHMIVMNPTKQALIVVEDTVSALERAQYLRKELSGNGYRKKINVGVVSGILKQLDNKRQAVVATSSSCLRLLKCRAISWKDLCLVVFDQAGHCFNDHPSHEILRDYYMKAKADIRGLHVPKLLGFLDSSSGEDILMKTVSKFNTVLKNMGDLFLSSVTQNKAELEEKKSEAMFVCVPCSFTKSEQRLFSALHCYLLLVFKNLAVQCQQLNSYKELLQLSFQRYPINDEAFAKFIRLTGKPLDKRLPSRCVKTWRHYLAICEVIFALVECGEDFAKVLLANLKREAFGFTWANEVGLPVNELSLYLLPPTLSKRATSGSGETNPLGSGIGELVEQLQIIQWENARVSSERPLALVIVKLSKTAKALANYLARYPELAKRNVKTTFVDDSRTTQQKAIVSAIKRRQYQVIVTTDDVKDELDIPQCELVILMDQPSTMSTLVKLRQKLGTNVVAICREADGEEKLKELLRKEEDVEKAVAHIREMKN